MKEGLELVDKRNNDSAPATANRDRRVILDDGWDALEVAKMSQGAFRHNHTAEPVTAPLEEVTEEERASVARPNEGL